MRTLKLTLAYDGVGFHGWQTQPAVRTVQAVVTEALSRVLREPVQLFGAGRTDAGVHAEGQVASFETAHAIPCPQLTRALSAKLPPDVSVVSVADAPADFHARFSARGKWYRYRLLERRLPDALARRRAWRVRWPLDVLAMRRAARGLEGTQDFRSLAPAKEQRLTVRTLFSVDVTRCQDLVFIDVTGDGFLHKMVRTLAGTLLEVGRGRMDAGGIGSLLHARCRAAAGPTLPPEGLTMMRVAYPGDTWLARAGVRR